MATIKSEKYLNRFKDSDHESLVKIVKAAQLKQIKGKRGNWNDFVANVNKKRGGTHSDPAKHPVDVLSAFLKTISKQEDVEMVRRIRNWITYSENQKLLNETHPFAKSPEQELVEFTHRHPRFGFFYNFQSWMESMEAATLAMEHSGVDNLNVLGLNHGWTHSKRGDPDSSVQLISLDCEMVVCEGGVKEVVRVCAVGSDYKTLADELVVPNRMVTDYLTNITGVSEKDLQGVTFSQADAQKLVMDLLTPGSILVGHSLHHDLRALQIDHKRVIDTSLLFRDSSWPPTYFPSLPNLCQAVLKYNFREDDKPHDCLNDAIVPMRLVHYRLEHDTNSLQSFALPRKEVNPEDLSKLLLHKLPMSIPVSSLRTIFPKDAACRIQDIVYKNKGKAGSTVANFESADEADSAFEHLKGVSSKDSGGYPQKLVTLTYPAGKQMRMAEFVVRKMLHSVSTVASGPASEKLHMLSGSSKKAPLGDENIVGAKRRRISSDSAGALNCSNIASIEFRDAGVDESQTLNPLMSSTCVIEHPILNQVREDRQMQEEEILEGEVKGIVVDRRFCCSHSQDLEFVKSELAKVRKESKARADEIKALQKLVAALSRREGLA